jgi:hypothetical protein
LTLRTLPIGFVQVGISPHFPKRAEEPDDRTIQPVPAPRRREHWTAQAGRPGASAYDTRVDRPERKLLQTPHPWQEGAIRRYAL